MPKLVIHYTRMIDGGPLCCPTEGYLDKHVTLEKDEVTCRFCLKLFKEEDDG
jgi:hypothetical protein